MTPARVLVAGMFWRLFGTRRSGALLLDAFTTGSEQNRMLAGMSLVRAGDRSFDLIERKISEGDGEASLVRLLPDIDDQRSRPTLARLADGTDPEVAAVANQCLAAIERQDSVDQDVVE